MNTPESPKLEAPEGGYQYNPAHKVATCGKCGREMRHNVPRLGDDGGFIHLNGDLSCPAPTASPALPPGQIAEDVAMVMSQYFAACMRESAPLEAARRLALAVQSQSSTIEGLREALEYYNEAASKFIRKVESGKARSKETYAELTECLRAARAALKPVARGE